MCAHTRAIAPLKWLLIDANYILFMYATFDCCNVHTPYVVQYLAAENLGVASFSVQSPPPPGYPVPHPPPQPNSNYPTASTPMAIKTAPPTGPYQAPPPDKCKTSLSHLALYTKIYICNFTNVTKNNITKQWGTVLEFLIFIYNNLSAIS